MTDARVDVDGLVALSVLELSHAHADALTRALYAAGYPSLAAG
jgi:hypothetical protein